MMESKENSINEKSLLLLQKTVSRFKLDLAKETVEVTNCSKNEMKSLTRKIIDVVSTDDNAVLMNQVANAVYSWKKDTTQEWKTSLAAFARENAEINRVYAGKTDFGNEFVIVMDDSSSDAVLDYNDFCFELCDRYGDIEDFMVLDTEEYSAMSEQFKSFKKIFQRG